MRSAAADRAPRPAASRPRAGRGTALPKGGRRPTATRAPASATGDPAKAAVAADVMAVLAAFGIED